MQKDIPRIAFLLGSTSSNGGIERVTSIIADKLTEKELAKVYAIGYQPRKNEQVYKWNERVTFYDLLTNWESMKTGIFKAIPRLRKFLNHNNIDVLVVCGHRFCSLGGLSSLGIPTRMIYWSHSSFNGEVVAFKKMNEHFGAIRSDVVLSLTKADEHNYRKKTAAKKVVQIYNPIDEKLLLNETPYNPNTKKIISVGRLDDPKNFESYLLEVAKIVLMKNPEYTWHIYGKGSLESKIRENIQKLGLEGKVILEGNVNNLYELYSNFSIMVMTSSYEGFPMTLLEGMSKKLPLISFDIQTGPNEIIKDNKNGFLIPSFDTKLMAEKLEQLIHNEDLRIEFSETNKSLIKKFKLDTIISQWISLIEMLNFT
tara:strand:+ start:1301 stop:2407 length:1107 start_codon:yes stop_codon:yes gene_type:complete